MKKVVLVIAFLLFCSMAQALPITDQKQLLHSGASGIGDSGNEIAQTFTVGITGSLSFVDVLLEKDNRAFDDLLFELRPTSAGIPLDDRSSSLATLSIPAINIPISFDFVRFDLSSFNLSISTGDILAIVLKSLDQTEGNHYRVGWVAPPISPDAYTSGVGFSRTFVANNPPPWRGVVEPLNIDFTFRTFVTPNTLPPPTPEPIPEPTTIVLLGIGLAGLAGAEARRRFKSPTH